MLRVGRIDVAEVVREAVPGDLGQRAGQLDAGRPAADDREVQPRAPHRAGRAPARPARTR